MSGIDEDVELVRGYKEAAEKAAEGAATSAQASEESRKSSETAKRAAETAQAKAEEAAGKTAEDREAVERAKTDVEGMKSQVTEHKTSIEQTVSDFGLTAQQVVMAVNNAGQTQTERVQGAGNTAVQDIQTAKEQAVQNVEMAGTQQVQAVQTEGTTQIGAVQQKGQEVLDSIPEDFSTQMAGKLDKNQGAENSGKVLVVGEDGTVTPGETPLKVDSTLTQSGQAADAKATGDTITALAIKKQASGEVPIIVTDSAEYPIQDMGMEGWTEQQSTTGAQLINQDETVIGGLTGNTGNEFDGTNRIRTGFIRVEPNTTYIISGLSGFNIANSFAYDSEKTMARIGAVTTTTTTLENESYLRISFSKPDQSDFTEEELQKLRKTLMFNKGDVALPWEPYTGNQPSPSPDYPQEIVSAGKYNEETQKWEYEVKVQGGNLLDIETGKYSNSEYDIFVNYDSDTGIMNLHSEALSEEGYINVIIPLSTPISVVEGKTVFKAFDKTELSNTSALLLVSDEGNVLNTIILNSAEGVAAKNGIATSLLYRQHKTGGVNGAVKIMVSYGQISDYEPYRTPQTVLLQSDRPLTKWDRLEKRGGQWGWVHKSGVKQLISDMPIHKNLEGTYQVANFAEVDRNKLAESLSTHFIYKLSTTEYGNFWFDSVGTGLRFKMSQFQTVEEVKSWLQENELYFAFPTAEETFVPLTDPEQSALEALTTYFPTTIIVNDADCEMEIEYVADTKTYIGNKFAELQTALANTQAQML